MNIRNIKKGDLLEWKDGGTSKVLAVLEDVYLVSYPDYYNYVGHWYTRKELKENFEIK